MNITYSIILKSQLEGALRLDAEYYQPEYLTLIKAISKFETKSIYHLKAFLDCSAFYPSIVDYYNFEKEHVPFLRVNEIQDGLVKITDDTVFLSSEIINKYKNNIALAHPGDILIAKGGNTLGKVGLLTNDFSEYAVSRDLIILRTKKLKFNKYYLWLFLHSDIGQKLLLRTASQTGQPHLTLPSIGNLLVPYLSSQKTFEHLFFESINLQKQSTYFYQQAENLLLEELGLSNYQIKDELSYTVNFSEIKKVNRIDAEYFLPKYEKLIEKIKNKKQNIY